MIYGFWSQLHGTGSTSNMLAIAISIAEKLSKKVIITQTHFELNNLEKPLLGNMVKDNFFEETGMDALIRHFKAGTLTNEQICNCSISLSEKISLIAGSKTGIRDSFDSDVNRSITSKIIRELEKYADIVLVDINSGDSRNSLEILKNCDVIVVTLRQNKDMLDNLMNNEFFKDKNVFYLIGNYDETSKYNLANLRRVYKRIKKDNSGGISHSTGYMDAISEDNVIRYFQKNMYVDDYYFEETFFKEVDEISRKIYESGEKVNHEEKEVAKL